LLESGAVSFISRQYIDVVEKRVTFWGPPGRALGSVPLLPSYTENLAVPAAIGESFGRWNRKAWRPDDV